MKKKILVVVLIVVAVLVLIVAVVLMTNAIESLTRLRKTEANLRKSGWLESETVREAKEMYENGSEDIEVIEKLMELFKGVKYKKCEHGVGVESIVFEQGEGNCMAQTYSLYALIDELDFDYDVSPVFFRFADKCWLDQRADHVILRINDYYCDLTAKTVKSDDVVLMSSCLTTDCNKYLASGKYTQCVYNIIL